MSPQVDPERIAHFRIVGRLGQGGMGIVYRAEDERLRRTVALKVLPDAFAGDEDRRRRLLREARSAAALTHANIATVYEVDEDGGRVFIAMELVEGETLRDRIARGRIPVGEVVRIARGIARGLARAHAKGIVHRDLKPDNVVIDLDGEPKILDFGLAKLREDEQALGKSAIESGETASQITREGHLLGTPQYMSPEQAGGGPADARSDVFALGILMYEMLTARRPFEAERLGELLAQIQRDPPTPLRKAASDVPADLAAIVERCMAKRPGERFATAGEVSTALDGGVTSGVKSQAGLAMPVQTKTRSRLSLVTVLVFVASGVAAVAYYARSRASRSPVSTGVVAESSRVRVITDWPAPRTAIPEAATLYAEGLQALRDASGDVFMSDMERAIALDPHLAAAHVRLALSSSGEEVARQHIAAATQARTSLDARDQLFLAFAEAKFGYPLTIERTTRAAHTLLEALPDDPEALFWAARALAAGVEAPKLLDRAIQLDPKFANVESTRALIAAGNDDADAILAAADRCLAISPSSGTCLRRRADVHSIRGECDDLELDARQMVAIDPTGAQGYGYLSTALASKGAPVEALQQLASKAEAVAGAGRARRLALQDAASIAVYAGDFISAEASLIALQAEQASLTDESRHTAMEQLILLYGEEGEAAKAANVGEELLRQLPAWNPDSVTRGRGCALAALHRGARLPDSRANATRDGWLSAWKVSGSLVNTVWVPLYAACADTPAEAREALAALPAYSPLATHATHPSEAGSEGRVYALAGEGDRATPLLQAAVRWCGDVPRTSEPLPIDWLVDGARDRFLLGQALEASDHEASCAQYTSVLARWSNAKPRSVTAEKARARSRALGCR